MTAPTCDVQLEAVAGICAARLERTSSGSCNDVVLYAPPHKQRATTLPALWAYRAGEKFARWGNGSKYGRVVTCKLLYVVKPTGIDSLEQAAYVLSWAVQVITDALINAQDEDYEDGDSLDELADIEQIEPGDIDVSYNLDLELPQVEITFVMKHRWNRTAGVATPIAEMTGNLNINPDLAAFVINMGGGNEIQIAPLVLGARVTVQTGSALDVSVSGKTVTLTAVAGVTKTSDAADAIADDAEASALMSLTGDDVVLFAATITPTTYALTWPIVRQTTETD